MIGRFIKYSILAILFFIPEIYPQTYPLRISPSERYLEDQSGAPFFLNADAAWSLIAQLKYSDADLYLTSRSNNGFNGFMANLIEHYFADNAPANIFHIAPFTGAPFVTPNEAYFSHADSMIERANQLGMVALLFPIYLGYGCGQEGWCSELQSASYSDMKSWGHYVGSRYKSYPNIIWVIGGDTDPLSVRSKIDTMVAGLIEADNIYPGRLITTHSERETQAITHWQESWVSLNNVYSSPSTLCTTSDAAYDRSPAMPFFFIEGYYENEHSMTTQQLRAQAYWTILKGACGHVFGNCPVWAFGSNVGGFCSPSNWQSELSGPGSISMTYFRNIFESRHWYNLVPDRNSYVLTSGAQTGMNLAVAAYTADSTSIMGYLPTPRTITIDPSVLAGDSIHILWYNPADNVFIDSGRYNKVIRDYDPPSAGDWVMIIDGRNFDPGETNVAENNNNPIEFSLQQNYPNPFNPSTKITFAVGTHCRVSLKIFDILGREIITLVDGVQSAGEHTVEWNGKNSAGQKVGSGIYFYQLSVVPSAQRDLVPTESRNGKTETGFSKTQKMMVLN